VTRSGVKVLDFGLAKMPGDETLTQAGAVMGTPAYMAPEQWEGKEADARSDIYTLGRVVYEMATGEREPHKTLEPAALDRVVKTCLAADPEERWQSAREVKLALELARSAGRSASAVPARRTWRSLVPWSVAAIALLVAVAAFLVPRSAPVSEAPAVSMVIPVPPEQQLVEGGTPVPFDVSSDGTKLVYVAREGGRRKLFLRPLDQFDVKPLPGTEDASSPFFSPDGRWVGFFVQRRLFKVATGGGSPVLIAEVEGSAYGACWEEDGTIVFGSFSSGLMAVSAGGGKPSRLTTLGAGERGHYHPQVIPGTPFLLFTLGVPGKGPHLGVVALNDGKHKVLMEGQQATYLPNGRLVYATRDVLRAAPFDLAGIRVSGSPSTLLDDVYTGQASGLTYFRITSSGMLVYVPGRNEHSLVRVDRAGHSTPLTPRRAGYRLPRLSRDGRFIAVTIDPPDEGNSDIWILDLQRGVFSKLTREGHNLGPVFTADGSRIAWGDWSGGGQRVFWQPADGSRQRERLGLLEPSSPRDFSPDGKYLVLTVGRLETVIWALPLSPNAKPFPLVESTYVTRNSRFSPDGRWLAYTSNESGRDEIYVRRFPRSERKWIVSTDGGTLPVWSRDAKEIFYLEGRRMMAVAVQAGADFSAGRPVLLFDRPELTMGHPAFDVMGDGFLMVERDPLSMLTEFRVVQNWISQWKQ
jgi:serine/threonine-protein kinase